MKPEKNTGIQTKQTYNTECSRHNRNNTQHNTKMKIETNEKYINVCLMS